MLPSRMAPPPIRSQMSRAMAGVSFAPAGWPISRSSCWMRVSEVRLRNVDCWS